MIDIPYSLEAEKYVLGACLFSDDEALTYAVLNLEETDFFVSAYQIIFAKIKILREKQIIPDLIVLKNELTNSNELQNIGGVTVLSDLIKSMSTTVNYKHHVAIIKEHAYRRKCIKNAEDIIKSAKEGAVTELQKIIEGDKPKIAVDTEIEKLSDIALSVLKDIQEKSVSGKKFSGLETGFSDLDFKLGGLQPSSMNVIAARPSMGKTAFALDFIKNTAYSLKKENKISVFFSLEMSKEQIVLRLLSSEAKIPSEKFRLYSLNEDDWFKIENASEEFEKKFDNVIIHDDSYTTAENMKSILYSLKLKNNKDIGLVTIDYLQFIRTEESKFSRNNEVEEISRTLKSIAKEFNCPVVVLSQLNRACEMRTKPYPILSDLRDSGSIEQDADVIMFLYRDEYYFPDSEKKGIASVIIAKQRDGRTGTVDLFFDAKHVTFKNLYRTYEMI